jgi:hypothetical protein
MNHRKEFPAPEDTKEEKAMIRFEIMRRVAPQLLSGGPDRFRRAAIIKSDLAAQEDNSFGGFRAGGVKWEKAALWRCGTLLLEGFPGPPAMVAGIY